MTTSETTTVHTMAADLATVLGATIPFAADPEYGIPCIQAVQLRAWDGVLTSAATDRYVLGYARQTAVTRQPIRFILDVTSARQIRKSLSTEMKRHRTGQIPVVLTVKEGGKRTLTVDFEPYSMTFNEVAGADHAPDLSKVIADLVQPGTTPAPGPVGLNAHTLKPFIKASKWAKREPMRWSLGEAMKPARVEIADWFIGLIMPTRLKDDVAPVEYVTPPAGDTTSTTPAGAEAVAAR